MARFAGEIGFVTSVETRPGVYMEQVVVRPYKGDITRKGLNVDTDSQVNADFRLSNILSVVADGFMYENFSHVRFVRWAGAVWAVTSAEFNRPRLILYFGGVYNGPTS